MIKLPYGTASYPNIILRNYYYVDKTRFIRELERFGGQYLFFIRPRRFGKSLFVSMLENYYDVEQREQFDTLFGHLDIGQEPTAERNAYLILRLDFSGIRTDAGLAVLQESFAVNVRQHLERFVRFYCDYIPNWERVMAKLDAATEPAAMIGDVLLAVSFGEYPIYLLIDEYDNFANELIAARHEQDYLQVVGSTGFVRTFYKALKEYTQAGAGVIRRLFMTGVSPLMLDDLTSGFNITDNITLHPFLNEIMGFTPAEVRQLVTQLNQEKPFAPDTETVMRDLTEYYNGYLFNTAATTRVFNSDMVLYFLKYLFHTGEYPPDILDMNVRTDYTKLQMLVRLDERESTDFSQLQQLVATRQVAAPLISRFSLTELGTQNALVSLLFYMGLVTLQKKQRGQYLFQIPNYVIARLYWEYFARVLQKRGELRLNVRELAKLIGVLAYDGELRPLVAYLWDRVMKLLSNRDLIRFDERGIKLIFLSFLSWSELYIPFSELELHGGYADVVLAPDPRFADVPYSWIIEFKYLKAEDDRAAARETKLTEGAAQVQRYMTDDRWARVTAGTEVRGAVFLVIDGQEWILREV